MKKRTFFTSILTLVLCISLILGSTYALLSSRYVFNIAIGSGGKVDLTAWLQNLKLYSMDEPQVDRFANGGTATVKDGLLDINLITPGDKVTVEIAVENRSSVSLKYRLVVKTEGELAAALVCRVTIDGKDYVIDNTHRSTPWTWVASRAAIPSDGKPLELSIELPEEVENTFESLHASYSIALEAVQGNAQIWDGTAETQWYDGNASLLEIRSAQDLAGIAEILSKDANSLNGKTLKLMNDIDLAGHPWTPIHIQSGSNSKIVIDGNQKTLTGLYVEGGSQCAFIGSSDAELTIRNLTFNGANVHGTGNTAVVIGTQKGTVSLENVDVINSTVAGTEAGVGALVGVSLQNEGATLKLDGCDVKNTAVIGLHAVGALVGATGSADASGMQVKNCVSEATVVYTSTAGVGGHQIAAGVDGYQTAGFTGENNTENSSVVAKAANVLYTAEDLFAFAKRVNSGDAMAGETVTLGHDIDLREEAWTPIGSGDTRFMGTFDGMGHTIRNLDVTCSENGGLFGRVYQGVVKNLVLENVVIYSGRYAGAVAAQAIGDILDCTVKNAHIVCYDLNPDPVSGKGDKVGGVVGYVADEGFGSEVRGNTVTDTYVSGNRDLGQLVGYAENGVNVSSNVVEGVIVTCNGYTKGVPAADLNIGGSVGNRD
ncbi:MAG: hypothetical protein E7620_00445 [Ruminococcaceae bacterium]|nr:hypothetical protein [Oscillospiraceae bacterium]